MPLDIKNVCKLTFITINFSIEDRIINVNDIALNTIHYYEVNYPLLRIFLFIQESSTLIP